jgi:hypothetical protein
MEGSTNFRGLLVWILKLIDIALRHDFLQSSFVVDCQWLLLFNQELILRDLTNAL